MSMLFEKFVIYTRIVIWISEKRSPGWLSDLCNALQKSLCVIYLYCWIVNSRKLQWMLHLNGMVRRVKRTEFL